MSDTKASGRPSLTGKSAGIAKILVGDGPLHAGMGIVVDKTRIVTCAHVVNAACRRAVEETAAPEGGTVVRVSFPLIADYLEIEAEVADWLPVGPNLRNDIAILELRSPAPAEAGIAILAAVERMSLDGDSLNIFGLATGFTLGTHVAARFMGPASVAWAQLDAIDPSGPGIAGGYSGAAVWDEVQQAVVGMVVARNVADAQHVTYMIPARELIDFGDDLPFEARRLRGRFNATWTLAAALFFVAMLSHFLMERGPPGALAALLGTPNKHLAAFWGMHIYAFVAPFLLWMTIAHARSFRLHPWQARVPSFGRLRHGPSPGRTRAGSAASLLCLLILPLYAQGHFLKEFHTEGTVFIYPRDFGFTATELEADGQRCIKDTVHLCQHPEAGRYSLVTPRGGAPGGFWDNAYHYGEVFRPRNHTDTFFPILQPTVILILTTLCVALTIASLALVFARPRRLQASQRLEEAVDPQEGRI